MITNQDLIRLQTRHNNLGTSLGSLITSLNGSDPNLNQRRNIVEAALRYIGQLTELVRIEEIEQAKAQMDSEVGGYRS
jgi:hypothetical protein